MCDVYVGLRVNYTDANTNNIQSLSQGREKRNTIKINKDLLSFEFFLKTFEFLNSTRLLQNKTSLIEFWKKHHINRVNAN